MSDLSVAEKPKTRTYYKAGRRTSKCIIIQAKKSVRPLWQEGFQNLPKSEFLREVSREMESECIRGYDFIHWRKNILNVSQHDMAILLHVGVSKIARIENNPQFKIPIDIFLKVRGLMCYVKDLRCGDLK